MTVKDVNTNTTSLSRPNGDKTKKSSSLPPDTVEYLKNWMMSPEHIAHPYPTEKEKAQIMADTGIEMKQLTNWFVNNRKRYWKPRVEARLQQQQADAQNAVTAVAAAVVAASQRCGLPDVALFGSHAENNVIQTGARPYGTLNMNQTLPIPHVLSAIIPPDFLHQHRQPTITLPLHHRVILQNNNDELTNPFSFTTDANKTLYPSRNPKENAEHSITPAVSLGSASSLASDSDSYSTSNDEPSTCLTPNRQEQFLTFSNEQLTANNEESRSQSSMEVANVEGGQPLPEVENTGTVTRHESINVNILSNEKRATPTIDDVSILMNEDPDRILKSYLEYYISYSFPVELVNDQTKIRKFRDDEIGRVKKLLLQLYLSSNSPIESSDESKKEEGSDTPKTIIKRIRSNSDFAVGASTPMIKSARPRSSTFNIVNTVNAESEKPSFKKKRLFYKYEKGKIEEWKNACLNAKNLHDNSLPSLEEAACLFGYNGRSTEY